MSPLEAICGSHRHALSLSANSLLPEIGEGRERSLDDDLAAFRTDAAALDHGAVAAIADGPFAGQITALNCWRVG